MGDSNQSLRRKEMASLFGVDIKDLGSAVASVGSVAKDIRVAITGKQILDPAAAAQIELGIQQLEAASEQAQAKINEIEAASPSAFVSGWRPFIGWASGVGFIYIVLLQPLLKGIFKLDMPNIDSSILITVLGGILGIGIPRTVEKINGVARN
jgi:hypothetical protein